MSSKCFSDSVNSQIVNELYNRYNLAVDNAADVVIGLGDSNTSGQGSVSYLVGLAPLLGVGGYLNLGISGTLFTDVGATANNGYNRWASQIISKPYSDYLVIQYGTNECTDARLPTYITQLTEKVKQTISAGWNPSKICLCSVPYRQFNASASELSNWRDAIQTIAIAEGTKFFDLLEWMRNNGGDSLLVDAVHLNQTAQDGWRDGVYTAFTS
jgi:lysophospholipase L1-like esterase